MKKSFWVIRIDYADHSTYVYQRYNRAEGRTLICPDKVAAERYVSKKAAESWFDTIRKYWRINKEYTLVAEQVIVEVGVV